MSRRHTAPRRAVERARIILLAAQNIRASAIAATLHVSTNTARKWIKRYTRKPPGTPTTENPAPQPSAVEPPLAKVSCLADLQQRLEAFVDYFNRTMSKPFKWTYQGKPLQGSASG